MNQRDFTVLKWSDFLEERSAKLKKEMRGGTAYRLHETGDLKQRSISSYFYAYRK